MAILFKIFFLLLKKILMFIFERERAHARVRARVGVAERKTQPKAASRLSAISTEPNQGLELTNCEIVT